ncbi:Flagellar L-ring protein [Desulfurobacterium thermolithotrophum DSM 11699]|uniref:Flagellar L-ring protein n=1 Tax=Desulfurobacterium thermolithotrophum (strain DSM 11699 / BSA) TaxID=868864 RepID=F0S0Q3_DESTD|nr:flagellar basal body L-ring protein FlgH [Desulfurobacterium thermolithotrophum]ADY73856.1 Flagellar L-ring protein [Desulfurobacterium thermolithotrophum DSM 11699]
MQGNWKWHCKICLQVIIAFTSIFLFSCGSSGKKVSVVKPLPPPPVEEAKPTSPGSLFSGYDNLFADTKARRVGDIVTVKIYEVLTGYGSTQSQSGKKSTFDINVNNPTLFGKKIPNGTKDPLLNFSTKPSIDFSGQGTTKRDAKLIATISARVVKVYPNGNLYIVGEKIVKINDDTQILKISGIVKPTDIAPDNSVPSSKIANMYVEYNGKGYIADNQKPGWLARFLIKIWPF